MEKLNEKETREIIKELNDNLEYIEETIHSATVEAENCDSSIEDALSTIRCAKDEIHYVSDEVNNALANIVDARKEMKEIEERYKDNPKLEIYILYIGGVVDSIHDNTTYIRQLVVCFPELIDTFSIEKYTINNASNLLYIMNRFNRLQDGYNQNSIIEGMIERLGRGNIRSKEEMQYLSSNPSMSTQSEVRTGFWREKSNGESLLKFLDISVNYYKDKLKELEPKESSDSDAESSSD
jgi:hypothetical protein